MRLEFLVLEILPRFLSSYIKESDSLCLFNVPVKGITEGLILCSLEWQCILPIDRLPQRWDTAGYYPLKWLDKLDFRRHSAQC